MSLYTKGQLVWAKIKGYPWWPGVIAETNLDKNGKIEKEILVNFIGENSHAVLTQDKVADFMEKEKQYSKSKNKKLQESICIAQRILSGEVTYEEERQKLISEAAAQKSTNEEKVKPSNRGRPSLKKKTEAESEKAASEKDKEITPDVKETPEKIQEKHLYSFKEDVLGLYKKKSSSEKDMDEDHLVKDSPKLNKPDKDSRFVQKQKIKEKEKERKTEREIGSYNDLLPFRITRLGPSDTNIESSSLSKNRKKSLKSDSSKLSKRETSTTSEIKHGREIQEALEEPTRAKARLLIDDDDLLSGYQNSHMPPCVNNDKPEEEYMESPTKPSERRFSEKMEFTEEKESHRLMDLETNASHTNGEEKMTLSCKTERTEPTKPMEVSQASTSMNAKRPSPDIVKSTSVTHTNQSKEKVMGEAEYNDYASKKVKLAKMPTVEDEKELDEKVLGPEVYNMLLIKKFEDNLTRILDKLSNKFQGMERLKEYDVDMIKILEVIEEFESRNFNGSEFIGSDLGKILKTVHFLLIENKPKLPKTGDLVIIALAKVLHKIKDKILKFCLDNTEYMDALHLPKDRVRPVNMTAIDIDFEEIKAKIEEIGNDSKADAFPISMKMEEESTSAYSQPLKQPVQNNDLNVSKQPTVQAPVQQAPVVQPTYAGIKEISKENDKENQAGKPNETLVNDMNLLLRKKICQKLAKLLQRSYYMDKDRSQKMTLLVEDKLNKFYTGNVNDYKQAIKNLHKLIKMQTLKEDELTKILTMSLQEFQQILREKLSEAARIKGGLYNNDLSPIDNDLQKGTSAFDFNTYLNPKTNNHLISEDKSRKKSGKVQQKMIVEDPDSFASNLKQEF